MTEKEKRKVNPRRRLLLRLILGIGMLVALISAGIYALRPTGAQIVFIAPDDNGVDQIWIADLNNPEHPRQLTFHADNFWVSGLQVTHETRQLVYTIRDNARQHEEIWLLNLKINTKELLHVCDSACSILDLHPNDRWLAYRDRSVFKVLDLQDNGQSYLDSSLYGIGIYGTPMPQWIGDSDTLMLGTEQERFDPTTNSMIVDDRLVLYKLSENRIFKDDSWYSPDTTIRFSPDGTLFISTSLFGNRSSTIRHLANPGEIIFEVYGTDRFFPHRLTWHPDNQTILASEAENNNTEWSLVTYDIFTGERTVFLTKSTNQNSSAFQNTSYNFDASQILYEHKMSRDISQIMLYNMETGEETALPLFGYSPQWVNGGH